MNPVDFELPAAGEMPAPFQDPIGAVGRRWRLMLAALLLGVMASVAVWFLVEPRYRAEATVIVARKQVSDRLVEPTIQEDALTRVEALAAEVLSESERREVGGGIRPVSRASRSGDDGRDRGPRSSSCLFSRAFW